MSTLKVNAISDSAGANGNAITLATDGSCTVKATNNLSNRNLIINGAMNVAQRGTSDTSDGQGYTTVDRWYISWGGLENVVEKHQEQLSSSDTGPWEKGFRNAWKLTNGDQTGGQDANGYIIPQYAIEAQDLASSGWNYKSATSYITLSFWVKSSVAQTFYGFLRSDDGTAQNYSFSYALSANTWTKVTKTIPGNSNLDINNDTGNGMSLMLPTFLGTSRTDAGNTLNTWAAYSGSNRTPDYTTTWYTTNDATWHMTGVQLEVSDHATEFEHLPYGVELARCQRYCVDFPINSQLGLGQVYSGSGYVQLPVALPVPMRTKPSVSKNGSYWFNSNYGNSGYSGDRSVTVETPATGSHMYRLFVAAGSDQGNATTVWCQLHDAAGTYMRLDAEL